jgi:hypothetical protein
VILVIAIVAIAIFWTAVLRLGIVPRAHDALGVARETTAALRDRTLDDRDRERLTRRASARLAGAAMSIITRTAIALGASLVPIWLGGAAGLARAEAVVMFLTGWAAIPVTVAVCAAGYFMRGLRWRTS